MANAIKASKPNDDRFLTFLQSLDRVEFDTCSSPLKLDHYILSLSSRLQMQIDIGSVRGGLRSAAVRAARYEIYLRREFPAWKSQADDFLSRLKALRVALNDFRAFAPDHLSEVLINLAEDDRSPAKACERVELETSTLLEFLGKVDIRLLSFLEVNVLPEYELPSNRADYFIREFAKLSAEAWRKCIRPSLETKRDRSDYVGLLGTALDEFGYPRVGDQVNSDVWLYQRVGTFDIWK